MHHLRRNWTTLGPKLVDKLHIYVGTMDNFYLDVAVRELDRWMRQTVDPHYPGVFRYGEGKGHCWQGESTTAQRLEEMARHIVRHGPADAATPWWERR